MKNKKQSVKQFECKKCKHGEITTKELVICKVCGKPMSFVGNL